MSDIAPEIVEKAARAMAEYRIRQARRFDTEPTDIEARLPAAVKHAWPQYKDEATAALLAVLPDIREAERERCAAMIEKEDDEGRRFRDPDGIASAIRALED